MGAPRKNPPPNAIVDIRRLAAEGSTYVGIAKFFRVAKETLNRWLDDDLDLAEAFEQGKDEEREKLHNALSKKALAGDIVAAMFLLKSRHKYDDRSGSRVDVAVDVQANYVMVVKDHGDDATWALKAAEQQRRLTAPESNTAPRLEAPTAKVIDAVAVAASYGPPAYIPTGYVPEVAPEAPPAPAYPAPVWRRRA